MVLRCTQRRPCGLVLLLQVYIRFNLPKILALYCTCVSKITFLTIHCFDFVIIELSINGVLANAKADYPVRSMFDPQAEPKCSGKCSCETDAIAILCICLKLCLDLKVYLDALLILLPSPCAPHQSALDICVRITAYLKAFAFVCG